MRQLILNLDMASPLVDITVPGSQVKGHGFVREQFRQFLLQVQERGLLIGTGSPEGVIEAEQGVEYMDDAGTAGAIKYIKRDANVGGDKSLGWILV